LGHLEQGSVLELEFHEAPKKCVLYDGYLTVITRDWHFHLCIEETLGGPNAETSIEVRQQRLISKGAFYRRINPEGEPRSWGIQFWNGAGEKAMTIFLPNPYVEDENLLPEGKADFRKLNFYQELRDVYVLGKKPIPFTKNPLKEAEKKGITSFEDRKHWKSEGLYYAILSNNAEHFLNANKDILSDDEYRILCETVVNSEKGLALDILKKLLVKLKKRKLRIKSR
jgi:hypothetical protein